MIDPYTKPGTLRVRQHRERRKAEQAAKQAAEKVMKARAFQIGRNHAKDLLLLIRAFQRGDMRPCLADREVARGFVSVIREALFETERLIPVRQRDRLPMALIQDLSDNGGDVLDDMRQSP